MLGRVRATVSLSLRRVYAMCCAARSYWEIQKLLRDGEGPLCIVALVEHMGDIVACLPVAADLKRKDPNTRIIWIAHPAYAELLRDNPNLSKVILQTSLGQWILLKPALRRTNVSIIDLHLHGKICAKTMLTLHKPDRRTDVNSDNYYKFGSLLESFTLGDGTAYPKDPQPDLSYAVRSVSMIKAVQPYVVLHTLSNEAARNWTAKKFSMLTQHLINEGFDVVEIGRESIINNNSSHFHSMCGHGSLQFYVSVIAGASLFIGIDSGFAHIAGAVRVKGVVILGSYRAFNIYMPYSGYYSDPTNCTLVRANGLPASEVDASLVVAGALYALRDARRAIAGLPLELNKAITQNKSVDSSRDE
jgi:heptosyltransferase-3